MKVFLILGFAIMSLTGCATQTVAFDDKTKRGEVQTTSHTSAIRKRIIAHCHPLKAKIDSVIETEPEIKATFHCVPDILKEPGSF